MSKENKSVAEIIEEVCCEICDKYCKYPSMYTEEEWQDAMDEICTNCPLQKLG